MFFSLAVLSVFAIPLENLVPASLCDQLRSNSELIIETQLRNPSPKLLPQNNDLQQFVDTTRNAFNPNMMVEALYLYKKPAVFNTSVNYWNEEQKNQIFNQLLAISTLTGIQYYSASRGAMRIFYESSVIIDGPQTRNPLPDPVYTRLPEKLTLYARQKDLTFGDNVYRYDYINTENTIIFSQENVTALNYGIITAIGRGNLRSTIAIIDCGDSILIYVISMARASSLPGMGERISNSFNNRAEAVLNWLTGRLDNELFKITP